MFTSGLPILVLRWQRVAFLSHVATPVMPGDAIGQAPFRGIPIAESMRGTVVQCRVRGGNLPPCMPS